VIQLSVAAALIALLLLPRVANAHERRDVAGYQFVVGFIVEPAYEGVKNGVDLRISKDSQPFEGADKTLQVEIAHTDSGAKHTFPIRALFNDPGHYTADVLPTAAGRYAFRFFGTLADAKVDQTFTSGPNTFGDVESPTAIEFPNAVPQARELVAGVRGATDTATAASDSATSARTLAIVGIVIGVLGLAAGGGGIALAMRRTSTRERAG
jgi:hypothetical protein